MRFIKMASRVKLLFQPTGFVLGHLCGRVASGYELILKVVQEIRYRRLIGLGSWLQGSQDRDCDRPGLGRRVRCVEIMTSTPCSTGDTAVVALTCVHKAHISVMLRARAACPVVLRIRTRSGFASATSTVAVAPGSSTVATAASTMARSRPVSGTAGTEGITSRPRYRICQSSASADRSVSGSSAPIQR